MKNVETGSEVTAMAAFRRETKMGLHGFYALWELLVASPSCRIGQKSLPKFGSATSVIYSPIWRTKVAACAKHFVGDGGTMHGKDESNTVIDWEELLRIHMPAYYPSILMGVSTVMVSYSSLNGEKMHANPVLVTNFLKGTLNFKIMIPNNHTEFIDTLTYLVKNGFIPMDRIDDAVTRILRVKLAMGLFEDPWADLSLADQLGSKAHRDMAREAVRKSLVLLKNDGPLLPLPKKATRILVAGTHANNIGNQCGGWTIAWQGKSGNITTGTTILEAVISVVDPTTEVVYNENPDAEFMGSNEFSYAIVVVGEYPYAEYDGDSADMTIPEPGPATITAVCGSIKCVTVLVSGRPLVVEPYLPLIDAFAAAWFPGSEVQGVSDVLFGDYEFTGKLPRTWFKTVDQLPMNVSDSHYDPLFPFGFGLTATQPIADS
ncbi:unnamed protein product [Cuscuta campestris]|uniref:Glycoside hydrolase family 3 C-terminal domain-containing protein n=1 Tax=Cuscuta campestris TaxID=132261 RepID=A0A484N466_9ASTE|nr:unnamed protein product [Cuscuta campestris]